MSLNKKLETKSNFENNLDENQLLSIIHNLGSLDKGYSNKLAKFINEHGNEASIYNGGVTSRDIEESLKKYNQISALRVFKRKQAQYK